MIAAKPGRAYYSEAEAAEVLGVSVERLRELIRRHITESDEDLANLPVAHFQPVDLLLLKILASRSAHSTPQG